MVEQEMMEFVLRQDTYVVPLPSAGKLLWNGEQCTAPFKGKAGDTLTFIPNKMPGVLAWKLEIVKQGLSVIANVEHEQAGHYVFQLPNLDKNTINIADYVQYQTDLAERSNEREMFEAEVQRLRLVFGFRTQAWEDMLAVKGRGVVVIAEARLPVPPVPPVLQDFVEVMDPVDTGSEQQRVDFFASKIKLVSEETVLARKIPGTLGVHGIDVFGRILPAPPLADFQFVAKKNVRISDDGLEVVSTCAGLPVRVNTNTYMVEHVYILNQDLDLTIGSIDFPGDVYIYGDVQDGMRIKADGKVEIWGSVSHAEIRAEKGLTVHKNFMGGRAAVGEKYVVRSTALRLIAHLSEDLDGCLTQTAQLMSSSKAQQLKPGQVLKLILERSFAELPKLASEVEDYVLKHADPLLTEGLQVAVRTAKRFLAGLGPMDPQALPLLQRVNTALKGFIEEFAIEIPEQLVCSIDYLQGAVIDCGGNFECQRGAYNSTINAIGSVKIVGVCRGGKVTSGGKTDIGELGGSEVSHTFVQLSGQGRLFVSHCHANVIVVYNKQIITIDEPCRQLDVYYERGVVQVDKLKIHGS